MMFFYCILIRCQAEHICERSEVAMKVRPQAEPGSDRAKRVSSFPYVIKSSRPRPSNANERSEFALPRKTQYRHRGRRPRCPPCERSEQWGWHAKSAGVSPSLYNIKFQESLTDINSNPLPDVVESCGLKIWMPDYSETCLEKSEKSTFLIRGGSKRGVKLPKFPIRITLGKVFASGFCTSRHCIKLKFAMNVGHLRYKNNQS